MKTSHNDAGRIRPLSKPSALSSALPIDIERAKTVSVAAVYNRASFRQPKREALTTSRGRVGASHDPAVLVARRQTDNGI
jgi:hypothetical protein